MRIPALCGQCRHFMRQYQNMISDGLNFGLLNSMYQHLHRMNSNLNSCMHKAVQMYTCALNANTYFIQNYESISCAVGHNPGQELEIFRLHSCSPVMDPAPPVIHKNKLTQPWTLLVTVTACAPSEHFTCWHQQSIQCGAHDIRQEMDRTSALW